MCLSSPISPLQSLLLQYIFSLVPFYLLFILILVFLITDLSLSFYIFLFLGLSIY